MARGPRTFRLVEYRPTAHGARSPRSLDLAWLCCGPTRGGGGGRWNVATRVVPNEFYCAEATARLFRAKAASAREHPGRATAQAMAHARVWRVFVSWANVLWWRWPCRTSCAETTSQARLECRGPGVPRVRYCASDGGRTRVVCCRETISPREHSPLLKESDTSVAFWSIEVNTVSTIGVPTDQLVDLIVCLRTVVAYCQHPGARHGPSVGKAQ